MQPSNPTSANEIRAYRLSEFSTEQFFRGFTRDNSGEHFFNFATSAEYALQVLGFPFLPFLGYWLIVKMAPNSELGRAACYFVLALLSLGALLAWIEIVDMILWPRYRVIEKAKENDKPYTGVEPREFLREVINENRVLVFCIHKDDWQEVNRSNPQPPSRFWMLLLIKSPFYLVGLVVGGAVIYSMFDAVVALPLNTVLLLVIIFILATKSNSSG